MDYTIVLTRGDGSRLGPDVLLRKTYPPTVKVNHAVASFINDMIAKQIVWELDMALHIDDPRND
jgi:hypothetical protein